MLITLSSWLTIEFYNLSTYSFFLSTLCLFLIYILNGSIIEFIFHGLYSHLFKKFFFQGNFKSF